MTLHHEEESFEGIFDSCEVDMGLGGSIALGNGFDIAPAAFNTAEACTLNGDR